MATSDYVSSDEDDDGDVTTLSQNWRGSNAFEVSLLVRGQKIAFEYLPDDTPDAAIARIADSLVIDLSDVECNALLTAIQLQVRQPLSFDTHTKTQNNWKFTTSSLLLML